MVGEVGVANYCGSWWCGAHAQLTTVHLNSVQNILEWGKWVWPTVMWGLEGWLTYTWSITCTMYCTYFYRPFRGIKR